MLFKKKEKKLELLYKENIKVNCKSDTKENVIRAVGNMLVNTGYVDAGYVEGMLEREKTFSTFMGNGLALPHGVEAVKKEVKQSGIAVMIFPDGVDWDGNEAKIIIGIAGVGDEHLSILASIAEKMLSEEAVEELLHADVDKVYHMLAGK